MNDDNMSYTGICTANNTGSIVFGPSDFYSPMAGLTINTVNTNSITMVSDKHDVLIWNKGSQPNPEYAHDGDAGMDIRSDEDITLYPGMIGVKVKTGIHVKIPYGYEIQIRARSGMAAKTPLRISNGVGTIDTSYTGELMVLFDNIGSNEFVIKKGDRIAQIVLNKVPSIKWKPVFAEDDLGDTTRGAGGFGSTGTK